MGQKDVTVCRLEQFGNRRTSICVSGGLATAEDVIEEDSLLYGERGKSGEYHLGGLLNSGRQHAQIHFGDCRTFNHDPFFRALHR